MYWVDTWIYGGTRGGNWAIGSTTMAMLPARIISKAMTDANIGRSMKKFTKALS